MARFTWPDAFIAEARQLWDQEGLSAIQIAGRLNVSPGVISGLSFRNGFAERPSPIKPAPTKLRARVVQAYRYKPGPPVEIAARLGLDPEAVFRAMKWARSTGKLPPMPEELISVAMQIGVAHFRARIGEDAYRREMSHRASRAKKVVPHFEILKN